MVRVLAAFPLAGGVTVGGANAQVRPAGRPAHSRPTALANAFSDCTVQALVPVAPWTTVRAAGLQDRPKFTSGPVLARTTTAFSSPYGGSPMDAATSGRPSPLKSATVPRMGVLPMP